MWQPADAQERGRPFH